MPDSTMLGLEACPGLQSPASPASSPSKELSPKPDSQQTATCVIGSSLSQVTGVKPPLTHTESLTKLPTFGVETEQEKELSEVAEGIDHWGMDMFIVRDLSNGHPLLTVFYTILKVRSASFLPSIEFRDEQRPDESEN